MADKPIIFSGPMVRAILDGRKTQTRRVLKPQPRPHIASFQRVFKDPPHFEALNTCGKPVVDAFPQGKHFVTPYPSIRFGIGDRLWVREAHYLTDDGDYEQVVYAEDREGVAAHLAAIAKYEKAPWATEAWLARHHKLRPSIHMPRWASRLTLTVTDVGVQRVQEISSADAIAEGCPPYANSATIDCDTPDPRSEFRDLWDSINAKRGCGWDANPWVVALTFSVEKRNIDAGMPGVTP